MKSENVVEAGNEIVEVDFAREFQESIVLSSVITFKTPSLKEKIMSSKPDKLLVITSTINSPKQIESVDEYNEEFLMKSL